jgi:hypothetical protein
MAASLHRLLRERDAHGSFKSARFDIRVFWDDLLSAQNRAALQGRTENLVAGAQIR